MPDDIAGTPPDGNWYILAAGLPPITRSVTLAPGISLRPLGNPLSTFDLAAAGAVGFSGWSVVVPVAAACASEIESAKDSDVTPGYDTLNRAWLASAMLVLRGFSRHICVACSGYSWSLIAGHQQRSSPDFRQQLEEESPIAAVFSPRHDLPRFKGQLLDFHLHILSPEAECRDELSDDDAQWIREHFDTFNRLAAESEPFRFALEACIDWRYAKDMRSAVSRLWAGIEAVFGISSELVYRISLLSASLLAPRGEQRRNRFQEVKKLYGLRSKAVHGSALSQDKLQDALVGSYSLLRELLLLAIDRGHALGDEDFDEAVFC